MVGALHTDSWSILQLSAVKLQNLTETVHQDPQHHTSQLKSKRKTCIFYFCVVNVHGCVAAWGHAKF